MIRKFFLMMMLVLVAGCAVFEAPSGSQLPHTWEVGAKPISQHVWEVVDNKKILADRCGFKDITQPVAACTTRLQGHPNGPTCLILSNSTEAQAKTVFFYGVTRAAMETFWEHEVVFHCNRGLNHRVQK